MSGGVGGAKLADGIAHVVRPADLVIVANTGDDFEHFGLYVCPDLDTLLYTLAGINNPTTGWGRAEETWSCMTELEALGGETWFRLGDKDLATHLYRTWRLNSGASLSQVTNELRQRLRIQPYVLPMSDQAVRTQVQTDRGLLSFQHYFVRERCEPKVTAVHYVGAVDARASSDLEELFREDGLQAVIICPSNPILSIGPILAITDIRKSLESTSSPVIAVSPIVEGRALKGPTAKIMAELGLESSARTVAQHYRDLIDGFVLDQKDIEHKGPIEDMGIQCLVTNTVMHNLKDRVQLAKDVLTFARSFGAGFGRG